MMRILEHFANALLYLMVLLVPTFGIALIVAVYFNL